MNTPAATVTSTWAFVPPTSAMPYSTRITKAFLKTLSLIAPRNCVTNSGRKRRERSRTISGWRIGRSLRKATGGDHRHALSKRSLTYCRVPLQVNPAVAVAVPARRELPGCPRRRNAAYDRTDLIPVESAGATPCFGGAAAPSPVSETTDAREQPHCGIPRRHDRVATRLPRPPGDQVRGAPHRRPGGGETGVVGHRGASRHCRHRRRRCAARQRRQRSQHRPARRHGRAADGRGGEPALPLAEPRAHARMRP